jgi:hypothetical protein
MFDSKTLNDMRRALVSGASVTLETAQIYAFLNLVDSFNELQNKNAMLEKQLENCSKHLAKLLP